MSLSVNNSADVVTDISRFIGIAEIKVQTVNPTKSEIKTLFNREIEKEPIYWDDASKQRKLVFFYEAKGFVNDTSGKLVEKTVYGTHTIWLKNEAQVSQSSGKCVYIDNYGRHIYMTEELSKNIPENYRMDQKTVRVAYSGEADLVDFMKALCAPARDQQFYIPNIANVINAGDVSVLRNAINQANGHGNLVRALMGVRKNDGKTYQVLFNKWFDFGGTTNLKWLWKTLKDNKDYLKNFFGHFDFSKEEPNSEWFKLKVYTDGMENGSASTTPNIPVPSFANAFTAAQASPSPSTPVPNFGLPASDSLIPQSEFELTTDDDLPF